MDAGGRSVIERKVAGRRVGRAPIRDIEEIGETFAKLLDERLRTLMRTITSAVVIDCEVRRLSSVLERIPVPAMLAVIDVRGSQDAALMNIGMDLIFHAVDLRMGGDPAVAPTPTARSITAIDCTLCEDFIAIALDAFEAALRFHLGGGEEPILALSHFEQHVTMVRIAPEHSDVLVLRLSLDMGEAARSGEFDLVLPLSVLDGVRAARVDDDGQRRAKADIWSARMAQAAAVAPARLIAVLDTMQMTLDEVQALAPGMVLTIPHERRGAVEIRIEGLDGEPPLAVGRLGAAEGRKAVKLTAGPDPALLDGLGRLIGGGGSSA